MFDRLFAMFVSMLICVSTVFGQEKKQEITQPPTTRTIVGIKPSLEWDAEWPLPDPFNRVLYIHRADQSGPGREKTWVHRPLFAIVESDTLIDGFPAIVKRAEKNPDGSATLTFEVLITSEPLKQHLKRVLLNPDFTHSPPALNAPDIFMVQWPLEHCVIDCRIAPNGRLLGASADTGSLVNIKDRFRFSILFGQEDLAEFLKRAQDGGVEFDFRYTFSNRRVAEAEDTARASREVELAVRSLFTDEQKSGVAPILQGDYNRVQQWMRVNVVRTIRSQRADLLPRFNESLFLTQIFGLPREVTFEQLKQDDKLRTAVAEHLKPLMDKYRTTKTDTDTNKTDKEHNVTETLKIRAPEFSYAGVTIGSPGDYELKTEDKDKFTHETGVTLVKDKESNVYVAQSIKVYRVNIGQENAVINSRDTAILGLDSLTDYYLESAVPTTFTEKAALGALGFPNRTPFYDGVPLGTMLPYFGAGEAPRGYAFADGKSNWPDEMWVAEHLRGKPLPDMNKSFVAGTASELEIGKRHESALVTASVSGASVSLPSLSPKVSASQTIRTLETEKALDGWQVLIKDKKGITHGPGQRGGPPGPPYSVKPLDVTMPSGFSVSFDGGATLTPGAVSLNPTDFTPVNYGCRWIIRVK